MQGLMAVAVSRVYISVLMTMQQGCCARERSWSTLHSTDSWRRDDGRAAVEIVYAPICGGDVMTMATEHARTCNQDILLGFSPLPGSMPWPSGRAAGEQAQAPGEEEWKEALWCMIKNLIVLKILHLACRRNASLVGSSEKAAIESACTCLPSPDQAIVNKVSRKKSEAGPRTLALSSSTRSAITEQAQVREASVARVKWRAPSTHMTEPPPDTQYAPCRLHLPGTPSSDGHERKAVASIAWDHTDTLARARALSLSPITWDHAATCTWTWTCTRKHM